MKPLFLLLAVVICITHSVSATKPNVIFILADDLGYSDVSYPPHFYDLLTPNIDALAATGVKMENYYVQLVCTPARSSLLTGRYPCRYGLQHGVIQAPQPHGLALDEVTLANQFKKFGYDTHALGKWHLGFFEDHYIPTNRGFDTHIGYWCGEQDYKTHTEQWDKFVGYDFRNGSCLYKLLPTDFSSTIFERETLNILTSYANSPVSTRNPFFLYLAMQTPHAPLEPRTEDLAPCGNVTDPQRKLYCGLLTNLDRVVGNITRYLTQFGLLDNTIVVFSNDNGGWNIEGGYNIPFRGSKFTNWEGGVRGVAFVTGAGVPAEKKGTVYNGLMHITDWFPTLMTAVGGNTNGTKPLDGLDQWNAITSTGVSPRTEILHNLDEIANNSAIRSGDWKLIIGQQQYDGYFKPFPFNTSNLPANPDLSLNGYQYLFNIALDPQEKNNLYTFNTSDPNYAIIQALTARLNFYKQGSVAALNPPYDTNSDPALPQNGGAWSSWYNTNNNTNGTIVVTVPPLPVPLPTVPIGGLA